MNRVVILVATMAVVAFVSGNALAQSSVNRAGQNLRLTGVPPRTLQGGQVPMGRQGFIVGFGGGVGVQRFYNPFLFVPTWETKASGLTDFKIGYAPDDQLLLYYTNQVAWGGNSLFDGVGMSAFGISYMLESDAPGMYVTGGVGASVGLEISAGSTDSGLGLSAGVGYEFARHLSVGGEWMSLDVGGPERTNVFAFTFDWLYY